MTFEEFCLDLVGTCQHCDGTGRAARPLSTEVRGCEVCNGRLCHEALEIPIARRVYDELAQAKARIAELESARRSCAEELAAVILQRAVCVATLRKAAAQWHDRVVALNAWGETNGDSCRADELNDRLREFNTAILALESGEATLATPPDLTPLREKITKAPRSEGAGREVMADLHVFEDDHDTWVAESAEDATALSRELYDDWDESERAEFGEMRQLPDEESLTISSDDADSEADGFVRTERVSSVTKRTYTIWQKTQSCAEWAKERGRGHLGGGDG